MSSPIPSAAVQLLVRHHVVDHRRVIVLDGVIDLSTLPVLHDHLTAALREQPGSEIVVDLDSVQAIDDCGLGLLLGAAGRCRGSGGDLVVVTSATRLRERLAITGFDRAVDVRARLA